LTDGLPKGVGVLTHINDHIKNFTSGDFDKFALRLFNLIVQTSQDIPIRGGVVILHKAKRTPERGLKLGEIKAFKK
jgi:hypothetical protein